MGFFPGQAYFSSSSAFCRNPEMQEALEFPGKGSIGVSIKLRKCRPLLWEHLSHRLDATTLRAQREHNLFQL